MRRTALLPEPSESAAILILPTKGMNPQRTLYVRVSPSRSPIGWAGAAPRAAAAQAAAAANASPTSPRICPNAFAPAGIWIRLGFATMEAVTHIHIKGAREHNLKNLDLRIPRGRFVVITGPSGSGKSSLAFDTIYAEGYRKYMESLSTQARPRAFRPRSGRLPAPRPPARDRSRGRPSSRRRGCAR